jgi:hypothetical protein
VEVERGVEVLGIEALDVALREPVRRLFDGEAGVLRWGSKDTARKRGYQNLRIPQSVLIRVHHRRQPA